MDVDLYGMLGGRPEDRTALIRLPSKQTDEALAANMERITRNVQMLTYGEEQSISNRSSAESTSTLPDRPSMTPEEIAAYMDDPVALFAQLIQEAYNANTIGERADRLHALLNLERDILFTRVQIQHLQRETALADAVKDMLFESSDLTLTAPGVQLAAAALLVPLFNIPRDVVLRFLIATWGSLPSANSSNIATEAVWDGPARQLLTRTVKPTLESDKFMRGQQRETARLIRQWIQLALPRVIAADAANHNYIIDTALDAFLSLGDALNPSSECLHSLIHHLWIHHIVVGSSGQSLLSIATVNTETALVYIYMYPVMMATYNRAWVASQKEQPFKLQDALTIAFSSGAVSGTIIRLLEHALNSGKSIDTDRNLLFRFRRGMDGLKEFANSYALIYARADVLTHTGYIDTVYDKYNVFNDMPVPIEIVKQILLASSPSIWEWLVDELGHDDMPDDERDQLFRSLSDQIQENNQRWT